MNENSNLTPKIRFKGFTDAWEQRKVTDIGKISIGLVTTMTSHYTNLGTLLIRNSDIKDNHFLFDEDPIYLDDEFANKNNNRKHNIGDVITVHTGDVGTSAVIEENTDKSIGFATIITRPYQHIIDSYYLSTFLNTEKHKNWAFAISTGDGRTNYNLSDYQKLYIPLTNLKEQKKIADFIGKIDSLITLHQRKYDKLIKIKSSLLEKMFPKNSSNIPEVRFKGFTDAWEQRKLNDIANRYDNLRVPVASNLREKGSIPYYGASGIQDYVKEFTHNGEFVLIAEDGANDLKNYPVNYVKGPFWANNHVHVVQGKNNICDNKYLKYCFSRTNIESLLVGGGRAKLNANIMMNINLSLPNIREQYEIGDFINNLDNLITLHQRKLDKLQNIKKSLLEKMFV